jgi:hypothetical protein
MYARSRRWSPNSHLSNQLSVCPTVWGAEARAKAAPQARIFARRLLRRVVRRSPFVSYRSHEPPPYASYDENSSGTNGTSPVVLSRYLLVDAYAS